MLTGLSGATRPRVYRFSYIDKKVKAGRYPNSCALADDLGVSRRTILRDVEFMKDSLYAPLEYCPKNRGYYYTESDYSLGLLKLTEGELLSLFLGHNLLTQCKGTPYEQQVKSAFNKICFNLQETVEVDLNRLSDFISFDLEPLRGEEKEVALHFKDAGRAIKEKRTISIVHYSIQRDVCKERLVDPYQIRFYRGAWYLVGYCHLRKEIRIFALDRIKSLQLTNKGFTPAAAFNSDKYFSDSFEMFRGPNIQRIKIWFSPDQARYIKERIWHQSQKIKENPDGSLIISLETSGLFQVKRWVLSFGDGAKVLAPEELVLEIIRELTAATSLYSNKKDQQ